MSCTGISGILSRLGIHLQVANLAHTGRLNFLPCRTLGITALETCCASDFPTVYSLCVVNPEEVGVEDRLDDTGDLGNRVDVALSEVAVYPVRNVESSVCTQREEVVGRDRLGLASALQHEELRKDGNRFQPD